MILDEKNGLMTLNQTEILNNKLPKIPDVCVNSYIVFHIINEKIIRTQNDVDYGLISNITPLWWTELILYINTGNEKHLTTAKKYIDDKLAVVFYPELILNLNQQREIEKILNNLDYNGNIIMKTNSPFIIQACVLYPKKVKTMVYLGGFKNE